MAMADWVAIVEAAGFNARQLTGMDVFILSGTIIEDPVIVEGKKRIASSNKGIVPMGTTVQILKAMSDAQKQALRDRVNGTRLSSL